MSTSLETTLYLKYRPLTFTDMVGQHLVKKTLQNAIKTGKISHSYLFTGSRGTGKTSAARILAKAIVCENIDANGDPCNTCQFCEAISHSEFVDVQEIDAASHTGIDDIRDLQEKIHFQPTFAKKKVYIFDEVHMLSKGAFNALLKTLEEPPEHAYFILATTEVHKLPETITSRCQRYDFGRFVIIDIVERLQYIADKENINYDLTALEIFAKTATGGMRDAIGLLDKFARTGEKITGELVTKSLGMLGRNEIENFIKLLKHKNKKEALDFITNIYQQGIKLQIFTRDLLAILREEMINKEETKNTLNLINIWSKAYNDIKTTPIPTLPLDIATIQSIGDTPEPEIKENKTTPEPETNTNTTNPKRNIHLTLANQKPETKTTPEPKPETKPQDLILQIANQEKGALANALKSNTGHSIDGNTLTIYVRSNIEATFLKRNDNITKIATHTEKITKQKLEILIEIKKQQQTKTENNTINHIEDIFGT